MISKEDAKIFFDGLTKQFEEKQDKVNAGMINDMSAIRKELASMRSDQEKATEEDRREKDTFKEHIKTIESRLEQLESSKSVDSSSPYSTQPIQQPL